MTTRTRQNDGPVADAVLGMYGAYGDRTGFDAHLHADITIWERDQPDGLFGLPELDALRDQRSASMDGPRPLLSVHELLIDQWDQTAAVARYLLRADHPDGTSSAYRVTDVFTADESGWRIVHHHSEELQAGLPADRAPGQAAALQPNKPDGS